MIFVLNVSVFTPCTNYFIHKESNLQKYIINIDVVDLLEEFFIIFYVTSSMFMHYIYR